MPYTLTRQDFEFEHRNEHFLIFLASEGYTEGDEIENYAYMIWVSEQVERFKQQHQIKRLQSIGLVPDWKNRFTKFLRGHLDGKRPIGDAES